MIAFDATKLAQSIRSLALVRKKVQEEADACFRQKVYYLYERAVTVSPQFSGDFASNWNIVANGNTPGYKPWPGKYDTPLVRRDDHSTGAVAYQVHPHQAGDYEAVASSLARGRAQLKGVTTKTVVHFFNASSLHVDDSGQLMVGPDGKEKLRPENVIPTGTRIEEYVRAHAVAIPNMPVADL